MRPRPDVEAAETDIEGVIVVRPSVFGDDRGFFFESFNLKAFEAATGIERAWVQDNHSRSSTGVVRGIHYQNPKPQGKLVRCVLGAVWDVAVDLRRSSRTFLKWVGVELSAANHTQLWIPEGFGHGFAVLAGPAEIVYKTTEYFVPEAERTLRWDDPGLGIEWPFDETPVLSDRDAKAPMLAGADLYD